MRKKGDLKMARNVAFAIIASLLLAVSPVTAATEVPLADIPGSQDCDLLGRFEGSVIVSFEKKDFDEFTAPLSPLEPVKDKRDPHNNILFEPAEKMTLEGEHWRIVYLIPEGASPLEVIRNYQQEILDAGGETLFECKGSECGGDPNRGSSGGGGDMSLAMYLRPDKSIKDIEFSPGSCAQRERITDQRYLAATLPEGELVSVLTYSINPGNACKLFRDRTVAAVDIVIPKKREQKMVTVKAEEMASQISSTGSIALYGIFFDTNKWDVKQESEPTLEEIAKFLKGNPSISILVVGHTDNVGTFDFNLELSRKRAGSVVSALAEKFGIDRKRLFPVGVSFASPVASNSTEEGRSKNRRVELVEN
jgi:outer membrane protein OmpA-like peptidoglycan-associated protein